jgi:predicted MFS family arabinose efflux permease
MTRAEGRVTFLDVLSEREFSGLWSAWVLSVVGDQFALVALSLLVFDRTGSAALTAATYAVTFIPDLVGGPLLSSLADRFPRRRVMLVADLARAGVVAVMAIPGVPIVMLLMLLFVVQLMAAPFTAARGAMTKAILDGPRFSVGTGLMQTTYQVGLVLGFPLGAAVVTVIDTSGALLVDAATFLLSALLVRVFVVERRPADAPDGRPKRSWSSVREGVGLLRRSPKHQALLALACLSGFYVAPEGLVVPYADQLGAGAIAVGLLLAANPLGTATGMIVLLRFVRDDASRVRLLGPLAVATCAMLLPTVFVPGVAISLVLWWLVGFFSAHDMTTNVEYVNATPDHQRGQLIGLARGALRGAQGVGVLITGVAAQFLDPARVIAFTAGVGVVAAVVAARAWRRASADQSAVPSPPASPASDH